MDHELGLDGLAYRLRPVRAGDAAFIVELRNDARLSHYLHPGARTVDEQLAWLNDYFHRPGDWYFVIERQAGASAEGLVAIYDFDRERNAAEWGRWIIRPPSLAAVESAWLIYRMAFERLGLERIYCRTVAANRQVVAFHDACELGARRQLSGHFDLAGTAVDAIEHTLLVDDWPRVASRLRRLAEGTARRVGRD